MPPLGVVGHFIIGRSGKSDIQLTEPAKQFIVLEAKMFSPLSPGVRNAPYYDQAARTVGCMCEVLRLSNVEPDSFDVLAFHVIAPKEQIDKGVFTKQLRLESISEKVRRRIGEYNSGERVAWLRCHFGPFIRIISVGCISWEDVISYIGKHDSSFAAGLSRFYLRCKVESQKISVTGAPSSLS